MKKNTEKLWERIINKIEPADIIAFMVVAGVLWLNWKGIPTMLSQAISVIIGFYFGHKLKR